MKRRLLSLFLALVMVVSLAPMAVIESDASSTPPTVQSAWLVTSRFIEINWAGTNYINGAGASKEQSAQSVSTSHAANFEVRLNGTVLNLSNAWYWNITNLSLHGVRVNQNKTTLQLSSAISAANMTAIANGTATLDVRIRGGVTASTLNVTSTPNGAMPASAIGAPGAAANTTTRHTVINRPYYRHNVVSSTGIHVKGSEHVSLATVQEAARMVDVILSAAPSSLTTRMAQINTSTQTSTVQFVIFGQGEHSYNIPEHRSIFLRDNWNRAEGYGGSTSATSAANVLRHHEIPAAQRPYQSAYASGYRQESILAHEFGHGIMNPGMNGANVINAGSPTNMNQELRAIFARSRQTLENPAQPNGRRLWDGPTAGASTTYMSGNVDEFMATVVSIWFDAMANSASWGSTYGMVNTREQLRRYDQPFYNFLTRVLPEQRELSPAWARNISSTGRPVFPPEPTEPTGRWGPSVKIKSAMTIANNPAGSGIQTYIPFNAAANHTPAVELWWDYNTDNMRWFLEPVDGTNEQYFRIVRKLRPDYTQNAQRNNLVLTASGASAGSAVTLTQRSTTDQAQQWRFERQTNGTYVIISRAHPTMAITTASNATASSTRIVLGSATTATSRFWRLEGASPALPSPGSTGTTQPTTVTVTRNLNYTGAPANATVTVNSGSTLTTAQLPTPARSGFTFNGWFTAATGGTQVTTSTTFTSNTTIFARWT